MNIGPERRIIEVAPIDEPIPGELPDWLDPIAEPEPLVPDRDPVGVPG